MRRTRSSKSVRSSVQDRVVWILSLVFPVSPLLFGSNRPIFWFFWAAFLGATATWWVLRITGAGEFVRIPIRDVRLLLAGFAAMAIYMAVQLLPLGGYLSPVSTLTAPGLALASRSISLAPGDTWLALVRWLSYGLLFYLVLQLAANRSRAHKFITILYWITVTQAVIGLIFRFEFGDTLLGITKWTYIGSATGGFVNRNSFATYLAFGTVIGLSMIFERTLFPARASDPKVSRLDAYTGRGGVIQILIGWLVLVVTLFATNSRMGTGVAFAGMVVVTLFAFLKAPKGTTGRTGWLIAGAMVTAAGLLLALHGQTLVDRLGSAEGDANVRLEIYRQVLQMIRMRPWTGFGGNSFEYVYPLFHDFPVSIDFVWDKAHDTYLANWSEYGLVFGTLPLLIPVIVLIRLLKAYLSAPQADVIILAAFGIITIGALHSLVDFSLEIEAVTFVFVAVMATGYARATMRLRNEGEL
nr:O-antigen ligase family protein [uncultured Gellertiella sp.]